MAGFLGMRATDDWSTDVRPKTFRQGILLEFPNGDAPLTAINSMGGSKQATDPEFSYWSKDLAAQSGAVTAGQIYKEADLATAWAGTTTPDGSTNIYVQVTEAVAGEFRAGHAVLMLETANPANSVFGKVLAVNKNGASSYINVKALELGGSGYLAAADVIDIVGNINPEGGAIPDAITYDPNKFTNFTQIWRTPIDISRTAKLTKLRTGDAYSELKREALLYHGIEMEKAAFWGEKSENDGPNGKPERTTQGLISFTKENAPSANVSHYPTAHTTKTWKQNGEEWIEFQLELAFRKGANEKLGWIGSGALLGINQLVKQSGHYNIASEEGAYGIKVMRWDTPFGSLLLKRHPLFTHLAHRTNDLFIHEPKNLQFTHITDTIFKKDDSMGKAGTFAIDGTKEEFLTEAGYEHHFANTMSYLTGVGSDGATS